MMSAKGKAAAGANRAALETAFDRHNSTPKIRLHNMVPIEEGKTVADLLPAFSGVRNEVRIGKPNTVCPGCRKPFNAVRKPRKALRMYPIASTVPIAFSFNICGKCYALHQSCGADRDGVLAAVESYCHGEEASQ